MNKLLFSLLLISFVLGVEAQEMTVFGGSHTQLYGYTDKRYVDADKGDYLKALAWYTGTEFIQKGFKTNTPESKDIVLGGAVILYVQNGFAVRDLYAVPGKSIPAEKVPAGTDDRSALFELSASVFGGYQSQWWGAEGGLTVFIKGVEEKVRKMYDASSQEVDVAGRGWVFGDGSLMLPNMRLRLGAESLPHFVIALFRGNYDPSYGAFQARVVLPMTPSLNLQVGGSFFQTSSIFLEPEVHFGDYSVNARAGTILNYNNAAFTRVGILEGAFLSGSLGLRW